MGRPPKKRRVEQIPEVKFFKPAGIPKCNLEEVSLTIEEVEAIRLKDRVGLTQQEASERMEVSRPTFQRVLTKARKKVTEALIAGKAIKFEGGNYRFRPRCSKCGSELSTRGRHGQRNGQQSCPQCEVEGD
ncbi:MAG: DUF134 domain-containing protein [Bacillota bacterium]